MNDFQGCLHVLVSAVTHARHPERDALTYLQEMMFIPNRAVDSSLFLSDGGPQRLLYCRGRSGMQRGCKTGKTCCRQLKRQENVISKTAETYRGLLTDLELITALRAMSEAAFSL